MTTHMQRRSDGESTAAAAAPETVCAPAQDIIALNYELEQIKSLKPWTTYMTHDETLSDEMNAKLVKNVRTQVLAELRDILVRLKNHRRDREAAGVLSPRAARTILEGHIVVEAKRKVLLDQITENTKVAMLAAKAMAEQAVSTRNCPARGAVHGSYSSNKHSGSEYQSAPRAWRRGSVAIAAMNFRKSPILKSKETEPRGGDEGSSRWRRRTIQEDDIAATALFSINTESVARHSDQTKMPCVQFPPRDSQTLIEALELYEANLKSRSKKRNAHGLNVPPLDKEDVDDAEDHDDDDSNNAIAEDDDDDVIGFWRRSVPGSAIEDASSPVVRREPPSDRVRYIMSTRLGALPPTKRILEEYPIPKGILDALERHRHFHVDAFSLETSFDPIRVSTDTAESGNNSSNHGWECYIRRSVPMERKPVSFVLASLTVAHEQPVPPPSDIFHQHVLAAASSEAAMLAEVRQLYDHVHDAYREFRSTLHRNLDVSYLIDLAFRSSLNSISFFLEDDDDERQGAGGGIVPSEQTVKIPDHLQQRVAAINSSSASSAISKWRLAKKGAARNRRGAIALNVKSEAATLVQRHEMINKLTTFSAQEVRLMELWHSHDPDNNNNNNSRPGSGNAGEPAGLDPIAMPPALSSRFENVWRELQMPAEERLDLAIKYSSLSGSTRLTDAVVLWELSTALIREREEMLTLVRTAAATTNKSSAMIATEVAMLQDLTASSTAIKEALMLTYVEVGDFVTYGGNFYLARMEYEASELRELVLQSIETGKRRPNEDASLSDGTKIGVQSSRRTTEADSSR